MCTCPVTRGGGEREGHTGCVHVLKQGEGGEREGHAAMVCTGPITRGGGEREGHTGCVHVP